MKPIDDVKEMETILSRTKKLMDKAYKEENVSEFTKLSKSFADLSIKKRKFEMEVKQFEDLQSLEDPLSYFERL